LFGVLSTVGTLGTVRALMLPILPRVEDLAIDLRVLGFALAATLLTSVLIGIVPALRAGRPDLHRVLRQGGRAHAERHRFRTSLVVLQVALAVVLTVGAGLMLKNFRQLRGIDPGFDPEGVLTARIQIPIPPDRSELSARIVGDTERMLQQLRALPGVEAAGSVNALPLRGDGGGLLPLSTGAPEQAGDAELLARPRSVSGDYFRVMGIPLIAGERFPDAMDADAPTAAVISETTARRLWPDGDPVGRELWMGVRYRVIGVVGDVRGAGLAEEPPLTVYRHQSQQSLVDVAFVLRTDGDPLELATAAREAIWSVNGSQPVTIGRLADVVSASVSRDRFFTLLLGGFGTAALLLAALGLYGVLAYTVSRQTREIAIRRALGARRGALLRMVLGRGMVLAGLGVVLGLAGAMALTRLLSGMLYRVGALDPATYAGVVVLILATALLAAYLPAHRAMRTDPMMALKVDC
ncbi:MAG: FtsX-like permease family protein, partial [Gemmatimonadota bacterium]